MKYKRLVLLGLVLSIFLAMNTFSVFGAVLDTIYVNASSGGVEYANLTEHNTATPTIYVTPTGNDTLFNCTIYQTSGTALSTLTQIVNNTQTAKTFSSLTTGSLYEWVVTCLGNDSAIGVISTNSSHYKSEINMQPTISSVSISEVGYRSRGSSITFTGTWTDSNSSGTDDATLYICKDSGLTAGTGCSGTAMCSNGDVTTNSTSCTYTISTTETAGTKTYYAYIDDNNAYTSSVLTGSWYVGSSYTDEQEEEENRLIAQRQGQSVSTTTTTTTPSIGNQISQVVSGINPIGWVIIVGLVAVIIYFIFIKKK